MAQESTMAKPTTHTATLKQALTRSRREVTDDVRGRLRDGRNDRTNAVRDMVDMSDDNFRQAIDMTLLQMQAATLTRIDDALGQIDAGRYGVCVECGDRISQERLIALPFAVRCRECEARREQQLGRAQARSRSASPFSHVSN
jgi:DnaK suppressor protein